MKTCSVKKLKLHLKEYKLKLKPRSTVPCMAFGQDIAMRLKVGSSLPSFDYKTITIGAKEENGPGFEIDWNMSTATELIFRLTGAPVEGEFAYFINVPGIGMIDPIVRVVRSVSLFEDAVDAELARYREEELQPAPSKSFVETG